MATISITRSMQPGWRDAAWLSVALAAHGLLLLISFKPFPPEQDHPRVLALSILTSIVKPAGPVDTLDPAPPASPVPAPPEQQPKNIHETVQQPAEPVVRQPEDPPEHITAARLLDSASQLKWPIPTPGEYRELGVHQWRDVPDNWRPVIGLEDNLFDGMTVPEKIEVIDQWVSADGSQNVVINTPGGEALCGRRQAWDPLNPMIEPLMMFRACGGGGRRTFKMPDRYNKRLVD